MTELPGGANHDQLSISISISSNSNAYFITRLDTGLLLLNTLVLDKGVNCSPSAISY